VILGNVVLKLNGLVSYEEKCLRLVKTHTKVGKVQNSLWSAISYIDT